MNPEENQNPTQATNTGIQATDPAAAAPAQNQPVAAASNASTEAGKARETGPPTIQPRSFGAIPNVAPTRTMASDANRATSIESDRAKASQDAINEIKALEAALEAATDDINSDVKIITEEKGSSKQDTDNQQGKVEDDKTKQEEVAEIKNAEPVAEEVPEVIAEEKKPAKTVEKAQKDDLSILANSVSLSVAAENLKVDKPEAEAEPKAVAPTKTSNDDNDSDDEQAEEKNDEVETTKLDPLAELESEIAAVIKKAPEEIIDAGEDPRVVALRQEIARIEKTKLEFIQKRNKYTKQEVPIQAEIKEAKVALESAKMGLEPYIKQAETIEKDINDIEAIEQRAETPAERHNAENKRWELEDKRHKVEEQKWNSSRKVEEITNLITTKEAEIKKISSDAASIDRSIAEAEKRVRELDLEIKLAELSAKKEKLEQEWLELNNKKRELDDQLEQTKTSEAIIEEQVDKLQISAKNTTDPTVKREFEQERHRISLERRELEKKRWEYEQANKEIEVKIERLKPEYQSALDHEQKMHQELEELKSSNSVETSAGAKIPTQSF